MCGNFLLLLFGVLFFIQTGFAQSHGLQFSSHEVVQEKRTSLNLTPAEPFCLNNKPEIAFDLTFRPDLDIYFGYIVRVITSERENIDIIYNQKLANFNFVIGEASAGTFQIDPSALYGGWSRFAIRLDDQKQEASFYLNDKFICRGKAKITSQTCYHVLFGANDFDGFQTLDIPPMNIKDIRVSAGGKSKWFFALEESEGTQVKDASGKIVSAVKNPIWLKPRHQKWSAFHSFHTAGPASVAFDPGGEVLYILSLDSLYQYAAKSGEVTGLRFSRSRDTLLAGNQSIFDRGRNTLYNFYIDEQIVSEYDPQARRWDHDFPPAQLTVYWHANKFISPVDTSLYVVGGYGQLQYKNTVQRYHFPTGQWEFTKTKGDAFMPRYLAALGTNAAGDTAFIMGGYGSATGEQTINPKYNYDLMAFSVKDHSFHHIYHLKEPSKPFCLANSLVIDSNGHDFYALTYPNRFNSALQLIKGSLRSPTYTLVGDSIPYLFYDIRSFADLFYAPVSKKLLAVTLFTDKDNITEVKINTIDFPPNEVAVPPAEGKTFSKPLTLTLIAAAVLTAALLYLFVWNRKRKAVTEQAPESPVEESHEVVPVLPVVESPAEPAFQTYHDNRPVSSIFLFGHFEVFDKNGMDITTRFTPLIRELFLLILIYTYKDGKGISSEQLFETLWSDKPAKDARNNFSVNIVKLKHILETIGDCQITRESGKWKFEVINNSIYIDFQEYVDIKARNAVMNKAFMMRLLPIVSRGGLLHTVQYEWLDDIKSAVAGQVIDTILNYLPSIDPVHEAEFMLRAANAIFYFDQLSEEALVYKCKALVMLGRHGMAKETYSKFAKEYAENYGQPFERSFSDITGHA
jgi:DNA-binding SARP family transcriptional activator